jgi:hypothetical protein
VYGARAGREENIVNRRGRAPHHPVLWLIGQLVILGASILAVWMSLSYYLGH